MENTPDAFKQKIVSKYPQGVTSDGKRYADMDATELTKRIVDKFPNGVTAEGKKYSDYLAPSAPVAPKEDRSALQKVGDFGAGVFKAVTKPVVTLAARPFQLAQGLAGATPEQQDINLPFYGKIDAPRGAKDVVKDIGRGLETVSLGLPVAKLGQAAKAGAVAGFGSGLEKDASLSSAIGQGVAGSALGFAGLGATRLAGKGLQATGRGISNVGKSSASTFRESAEKDLAQVLAPTTKFNKDLVESKLAPGLRERGEIAMTRKGLYEKAGAKSSALGAQIDTAWEKLPMSAKVRIQPIVDDISSKRAELRVEGVLGDANKSLDDALDTVQREVVAMAKNRNIPQSLRAYRQNLDAAIRQSKQTFGLTGSETAKVAAQKTAANAIRAELANTFPDIAKLNKEFTFWSGIEDVLEETMKRTQGQGTPLTETMMAGVGAVSGAPAGVGGALGMASVMKALTALTRSTAWRTTSSSFKNRLADLIARRDVAGANALMKSIGGAVTKAGVMVEKAPKRFDEIRATPLTPGFE